MFNKEIFNFGKQDSTMDHGSVMIPIHYLFYTSIAYHNYIHIYIQSYISTYVYEIMISKCGTEVAEKRTFCNLVDFFVWISCDVGIDGQTLENENSFGIGILKMIGNFEKIQSENSLK